MVCWHLCTSFHQETPDISAWECHSVWMHSSLQYLYFCETTYKIIPLSRKVKQSQHGTTYRNYTSLPSSMPPWRWLINLLQLWKQLKWNEWEWYSELPSPMIQRIWPCVTFSQACFFFFFTGLLVASQDAIEWRYQICVQVDVMAILKLAWQKIKQTRWPWLVWQACCKSRWDANLKQVL